MNIRRCLAGELSVLLLLATAACGTTSWQPQDTSSNAPHAVPPRPTAVSATADAMHSSNLFGRVLTRIPTTERVVALTFDGGANADGVDRILATLADRGVRATFFLTGRFAQVYPGAARRIAAAGRLGNHTLTHPHLTKLSDDAVRAEVHDGRVVVHRITEARVRPLFRFPFGEYDRRTLTLVNDAGWIAIGWTVDSLGWTGRTNGNSVTAVIQRVIAARTPGEIVLMHLGSHPQDHTTLDAAALGRIIDRLRSYGYRFVTLQYLL